MVLPPELSHVLTTPPSLRVIIGIIDLEKSFLGAAVMPGTTSKTVIAFRAAEKGFGGGSGSLPKLTKAIVRHYLKWILCCGQDDT